MTEPQPEPSVLDNPITRRRLLQVSASAGAMAFLAACGTAGAKSPTPASGTATATAAATATPTPGVTGTPGASATPGATATPAATTPAPTGTPVTGTFKMASWIGYIDVGEDGVSHPSLDRFAQETGITVNYQEAVNDNEEFFATDLKGPLQNGVETGWDIVVMTDWMIIRLKNLGWLETIPASANFPTNLLETYRSRDWDPGNTYAAPWQSGMTGIGYDKKKINAELTSLAVFFDQKYSGKMEYLTEMRDTVGLTAIFQGADPSNLTQAQFDAAIAKIKEGIDSGLVRQTSGNGYVEDLAGGGAILAMAWSGDIATTLVPDQKPNQDFQWRLADEGGMLWTDNMCIPKGARNQAQAHVFINWYYDPKNAAEIEAYVNYVCPVKGADVEIAKIDPELVKNTLIFPDAAMTARLHQFPSLDITTAQEWESAFATAIGQ